MTTDNKTTNNTHYTYPNPPTYTAPYYDYTRPVYIPKEYKDNNPSTNMLKLLGRWGKLDRIYYGGIIYVVLPDNKLWETKLQNRTYNTIIIQFVNYEGHIVDIERAFVGARKMNVADVGNADGCVDGGDFCWVVDIGCSIGSVSAYTPFAEYDVE